jgi:hypothetical protein
MHGVCSSWDSDNGSGASRQLALGFIGKNIYKNRMSKAELLERLRLLDEVSLLELMGINSDDLVDAFTDRIEERIEFIRGKLEE